MQPGFAFFSSRPFFFLTLSCRLFFLSFVFVSVISALLDAKKNAIWLLHSANLARFRVFKNPASLKEVSLMSILHIWSGHLRPWDLWTNGTALFIYRVLLPFSWDEMSWLVLSVEVLPFFYLSFFFRGWRKFKAPFLTSFEFVWEWLATKPR